MWSRGSVFYRPCRRHGNICHLIVPMASVSLKRLLVRNLVLYAERSPFTAGVGLRHPAVPQHQAVRLLQFPRHFQILLEREVHQLLVQGLWHSTALSCRNRPAPSGPPHRAFIHALSQEAPCSLIVTRPIWPRGPPRHPTPHTCLLYTSDAADE